MNRLSRVFSPLSRINSGDPNGTPTTDNEWIVEERSIDECRPLRIVIIGAGISGIVSSIRIAQRIPNTEICVYEKNEDIGGTWFENRYPGCACGMDISAVLGLRARTD